MNRTSELATLAGGCFWCLEAAFELLQGVTKVESGYTGGTAPDPNYKQVCAGATGHAEVVQITFDPAVISFGDLLDVFFTLHDPTTLNRQGPDVGTQYRSAIFFHNPEQEAAARASKARLESSGKYRRPIVTEIAPASEFYKAEEYHQQYLEKRGLSVCHM